MTDYFFIERLQYQSILESIFRHIKFDFIPWNAMERLRDSQNIPSIRGNGLTIHRVLRQCVDRTIVV